MTMHCTLFVDIADNSALRAKLGDAEARHAGDRCLKRVERVVEQMGGSPVKSASEGILAEFADAAAALAAACEMQQRVDDLPPVAGYKLAVCVGFHRAASIQSSGDIAFRLASMARPGQIIVSVGTLDGLPALSRQSARALPALTLAGKNESIAVYEIIWRTDVSQTLATGHPSTSDSVPIPGSHLMLHYDQTVRELDIRTEPVTIGRDKICALVVDDPRASRLHAKVDYQDNQFVLTDTSTNGTWLMREGEAEIALKHSAAPLTGRGRISLGHPASSDAACVTYVCT